VLDRVWAIYESHLITLRSVLGQPVNRLTYSTKNSAFYDGKFVDLKHWFTLEAWLVVQKPIHQLTN